MSQIIKKANALCAQGTAEACEQCPYRDMSTDEEENRLLDCWVKLTNDTLAYIETLEERLRNATGGGLKCQE